jgi:hypothetical protein
MRITKYNTIHLLLELSRFFPAIWVPRKYYVTFPKINRSEVNFRPILLNKVYDYTLSCYIVLIIICQLQLP